ncbi:MAG: hypothetical protein CFH39_02247 [Alphaproteobacteria bacterium MarineAlpha10_Bin2]|nr:MAG: hypothetical protein CFH39_02247 [Alphaproteobacteria bacterium MarineAlpha10_Bin2]
MKARRWAMAVGMALLLSPATGRAQSDALLDNYNQYATYFGQGKFHEALPFALEIVRLHKTEFGADHPTAAVLLANVGELHVEMGRLALAEPLFVEAVKDRRTLARPGPSHHRGAGRPAGQALPPTGPL